MSIDQIDLSTQAGRALFVSALGLPDAPIFVQGTDSYKDVSSANLVALWTRTIPGNIADAIETECARRVYDDGDLEALIF